MKNETAKKMHPAKRALIIAAIVIAVLGAAFGIFRIIQVNFLYSDPVLTGYGLYTDGKIIERIPAADLLTAEQVLSENGVSFKVNTENTILYVQSYKYEKAAELLNNCGYDFHDCLF